MTANLDANDVTVQGKIKEAYERLTKLTDNRGIITGAGSACGDTCNALLWFHGEEPRLKWGEVGSARCVELNLHDHPLPLPSSNNSTLKLLEFITSTDEVTYDPAGNRLTTSTKIELRLLGIVDDKNGDYIQVMRTDDHAVETMSPNRQRSREFGGKSRDYTLSTLGELEAVLADAHDLLATAIG